jgi:hypothetical protein
LAIAVVAVNLPDVILQARYNSLVERVTEAFVVQIIHSLIEIAPDASSNRSAISHTGLIFHNLYQTRCGSKFCQKWQHPAWDLIARFLELGYRFTETKLDQKDSQGINPVVAYAGQPNWVSVQRLPGRPNAGHNIFRDERQIDHRAIVASK